MLNSNVKMNLWNTKNLPIPPINTYKASDRNIDIKHLRNVFQEGKKFFDNENYMKAEYAVMSIIVYRSKQKFRSSKDFKALKKVRMALDNYFKSEISTDLRCFMELIPYRYTDDTYLPNKNLLDYILVRLQGLAKLMERIIETCKITAYLFNRRMNTGHFWKLGCIIFSMVSRVYILAKHKTKFICDFYNKIAPFSRQLKNGGGRMWLPENYILPTDLQKWINVDWLDIDDEIQIIEPTDLQNITQLFDLIDDDDEDIEFCDEYIMVNDDEDSEVSNQLKNHGSAVKQNIHELRGFDMGEDVGEVIEVNDDSLLLNEIPQHDDNIDFGEVINIDNSLQNSLENSSSQINSSEIIVLENTSISYSDESCEDTEDVIELSDSSQLIDENTLSQNKASANDSGQVITILDDISFTSNLEKRDYTVTSSLRLNDRVARERKEFTNADEIITISESPVKTQREKNIKRSSKCKIKKLKSTKVAKSRNSSSSYNNRENTITISDSPGLQKSMNGSVIKNKKSEFQRKRSMKKKLKISGAKSEKSILNRSSSVDNICDTTFAVNFSSKKKKKKMERKENNNNYNKTPLKQIQTETNTINTPSKKRKLGNIKESPHKKVKRSVNFTTEETTPKTSKKKKKLSGKAQLPNKNAPNKNEDKAKNQNGKNRSKRRKKQNKMDNATYHTQQLSGFKHIANYNTIHIANSKTPIKKRRREKKNKQKYQTNK